MSKLRKFLPEIVVGMCIAGYLLVTLAAVTSANHILYNLEPYPDGILYALSARNFALGNGFHLLYEENSTPLWVPPLYSASLIPGYIISSAPQMFYFTNVVLGAVSIFLLFWLVKKVTHQSWAGVVAALIFCVHPLITWLPTVPMTENLLLVLCITALFGVLIEKPSKRWVIASLIAMIGLIITRYAVVFTATTLAILLLVKLYEKKHTPYIPYLVILGLVCIALLELIGFDLISHTFYLAKAVFTLHHFYNLANVVGNTQTYFSSLLGIKGSFLWLQVPVTTGFLFVPAAAFLIYKSIKGSKQEMWRAWSLLVLFFSQLPLLLIFYSTDSRYIILTIPLLAIVWGWMYAYFAKKHFIAIISLIIVAIFFHIFAYKTLIKEIISNNILHKSVAWQHQSILHFNQFFSEHPNTILVTALPPHLVDAYQTSQYQLLPLSKDQEFLQKGEWVWNQKYKSEELQGLYAELLKQNKELYISNAYITHQQSVISDYESYKTLFKFEKASEGCLGACDIYKLVINDTASNSTSDTN